jgi:NhaP-type Na+/H+ or K+/H+ antiporter
VKLRRVLNWAVGLPIAIIVIAFSVANREWIRVSFDPIHHDFPWATIDLPRWALFFAGVFFGLIAGWIAAWVNQGKWRRAARVHRSELQHHQEELARLRREAEVRDRLTAAGR